MRKFKNRQKRHKAQTKNTKLESIFGHIIDDTGRYNFIEQDPKQHSDKHPSNIDIVITLVIPFGFDDIIPK
jgi:hypothetical protein